MDTWKFDFVVIGSGISGLFAALTLSKKGKVLVVCRGTLKDSNSWYAQGGIAAVWDPSDSPGDHMEDTINAGAGLCLKEAVNILVNEGPDCIKEMIDLGVNFDSDEGKILLTREGAHRRRRVLHAKGDSTGQELEQTLINNIRKNPNISFAEKFYCTDLIAEENQLLGLLGLKGREGRPVFIECRHVLMASGGFGNLFPDTSNSREANGDGIAMAWAAGAVLADLEFIQFHPTVASIKGFPKFLLTEALRGEGATLVNSKGEKFMAGYHKMADLAPRDIVARAEISEMKAGFVDHVFLDARSLGTDFLGKRFPTIEATLAKAGLSLAKDLIPVCPAAHYTMGGIWTDLAGRTSLRGLYAAGEVACTGVHGANRLASNSLLECLVFGRRAALSAISDQTEAKTKEKPKKLLSWSLSVKHPLNEIKNLFGKYLGVIRNGKDLSECLSLVGNLLKDKLSLEPAENKKEDFTIRNAATILNLCLESALGRNESRGGHFREDFPNPDPKWENCRQFISGLDLRISKEFHPSK